MLRRIQQRLSRLEAAGSPCYRQIFYGWVEHLPPEYKGERHLVIADGSPTTSDRFGWCRFEEREGPAPGPARQSRRARPGCAPE